MRHSEPIAMSRDCEVIEIPSGVRRTLRSGSVVRIMQSRGGSYTVATDRGQMYRVDAADSAVLGLTPPAPAPTPEVGFSEQIVWNQLKSVYDPEIPVNIVDLGLVYDCTITPWKGRQHRIDVRMSMTAPGCGMGNVLKADVEAKLSRLPSVAEVHVEVVFDPPWHPGLMSEAARLQLGLDSDYRQGPFPILGR